MSKLPPKLQAVVDRFVDEFLAVIREMAAEELVLAIRRGDQAGHREAPAPPKKSRRPRGPARAAAPVARAAEPEAPVAAAEITDPAALLDAATTTLVRVAFEEAAAISEPEAEPESAPAEATAITHRLRPHEAVARSSNGGLVIRRARR